MKDEVVKNDALKDEVVKNDSLLDQDSEINANLIVETEFTEVGYKPVVDYGAWRVAILNYIDELEPENITKIQKHDETDEVFVLLDGECILFVENPSDSDRIYGVKMEPKKQYNIKKGVYHTHTLSKEGSVLIVENRNTSDENSPEKKLTKTQREQLIEIHYKKMRLMNNLGLS